MKGMPLPFDFERKGFLDLELLVKKNKAFDSFLFNSSHNKSNSFGEPTSVLDSARFPSRPTSSSTLSSPVAAAAGGSTDTTSVAAVSDANPSPTWQRHQHDSTTATSGGGAESELLPVPPSLEIGTAAETCAMEEWDNVMSESPSQEQSILRWIMGDVEDPAAMGNLHKVLHIGSGGDGGGVSAAVEFEFGGGGSLGAVEQGYGGGDQFGANFIPTNPNFSNRSSSSNHSPSNLKFPVHNSSSAIYPSSMAYNLGPITLHQQTVFDSCADMKPPIFNPQFLINQHQTQQIQNPSFLIPLSYSQQEQNLLIPPQAKRHNPGGGPSDPGPAKLPFSDTGQHLHPQLLPHYLHQKPPQKEEIPNFHQQQQAIIDQLYKSAELVQMGNPVLAQGILARLNHQLSPIGKPFYRAAFYFKEALQLLLQTNSNSSSATNTCSSPFNLIFKIAAYKSYSEISPLIQFTNFTCNQALLDILEGFDRIHIVDFDIGYGGQWASLMQELAIKSRGAPSLKITALASPSTHDQLELGLTRENLIQFASEVNISFEFEVMSIDSLNSCSWTVPFHHSETEAVAVNLPVGSFTNYQLSIPLVLSFVKQLSPRIVVSVDRGCDRTDLPFANHVIHALQSYSNLLESLDAVDVNMDALQKIERLLLQPGIEKIVMGRFGSPEKTQHWRTLFLSAGFSPVTFSNFAESQAECVVKRTPVRGFQVEKRQSSLVLCWQRKELISASAWRC